MSLFKGSTESKKTENTNNDNHNKQGDKMKRTLMVAGCTTIAAMAALAGTNKVTGMQNN